MSTLNDNVFRNNPVWNGQTVSATLTLTGGGTLDRVVGAGKYVIISNGSGQVASIHKGNTAPAILLQPGSSFEIAMGPGADIRVSIAGAASSCDVFFFN